MHFACMKTMTIRGISDDLHAALLERARRHRRSLTQQVIADLTALTGRSPGGESGLGVRSPVGSTSPAEPMSPVFEAALTAEEIEAAIREGRD